MKLLSTLFATILFSLSLSAQQPVAGNGRITGRVLDSLSQSPVEYATITLYAAGSTRPINGTTTNNKGAFTLDGIKPGNYTLEAGFIGYRSRTTTVLIT